ncbi:myogenesis-regulating glycosidase isoform X1 [Neodiprion virginianus]|uniref:myogenesis-regulating glycosidase isoform X1 n=2 Tax=Neodiprion virginianus TaxID=2961670 RepID=UPI001EE6CD16|nr:myogenesis-regulating glycosidase isoform X1 [Neodiprion virginianus]
MRKMKLLLQAGLIFVLVSTLLCCPRVPDNQMTRATKNARVDVIIDNHHIGLNIRKYDGTNVFNVLRTHSAAYSKAPLVFGDCGSEVICVVQGDDMKTEIKLSSDSEIITISRTVSDSETAIIDCYELTDGTQWFGGPQLRYQYWPVQHMRYEEEPYLPTHPVNMAVAERYWLSSKGIYIFVEDAAPLFIDQNNYKDKNLCLVAKNKAPYRHRESIILNYEIGVFGDPRSAHENVIHDHLGKPTGHPDERMIMHPIWSTWARYKANVSAEIVNEFADEILQYGFNNSQLEIDDNWETCYGSAIFDTTKFPNIKSLTDGLKTKGFRLTLWIHPFINEECEPAYTEALNNGYFVKNVYGEVRMAWWQGQQAAAIDFTNPTAVEWWVQRLKYLQLTSGVDSFKFDAGEISWLPQTPGISGDAELSPGSFISSYVRSLAQNFNDMIEARVGWRTQDLPIFIRMIDKDTTWTWNNGLPTLITTLLQMNINGYVHVLPDMIGGNGYLNGFLNATEYPSKEMLIRWLQTNVFMPSLQYSFAPWDFDDETVIVSKKYTDLHAEITPTIIRLMKKAVDTGAPLNPPIWWVDPTNRVAHRIKDEFLLGEEILVAPVVEEDVVQRDIYLPKGSWKDAVTDDIHTGPLWLKNYPAPLDVLPYFYKI